MISPPCGYSTWAARLYRAGESTAIRVLTEAKEAVRDLCRAGADMVADRTRTRRAGFRAGRALGAIGACREVA